MPQGAIDTAYVDIKPRFDRFAADTERGIKQQLAAAQASAGAAPVVATSSRTGSNLKTAERDIAKTATATKGLTTAANSATGSLALMGGSAARAGTVASAGVAGIGVAAGLAVVGVTKASIDFESAFSGVRKTVTATKPELAAIRQEILDLSTTIPVAATELARIGESAGQLGVATSAIGGFTKTVAELAVTTNLTADEAADSLARIANITQLPQTQFSNLGSTVVALGNKMAATESEIVDFGRRIAGAGKQVGLSVPEILGIGSALASVGIEAEAGGSSISTTIATMAKAVASGGKKLQGFADIAGVSADKFAEEFRNKPAAAITRFIEGVGRIGDEGGNVFAALEKIGLGGIRVRQTLLNSAGAGDLLRKSIDTATTSFSKNNALQREASIRFETTASKLTLLKNQLQAVAIAAGDKIAPAIGDAAGSVTGLIQELRGNQQVVDGIKSAFDNFGRIVRPVFQVFADNKDTIRNTFKNGLESIRTMAVLLKPLVIVIGVGLVGALKLAFFALDKINGISALFGDLMVKSVTLSIAAFDKFLGAISSVADGLSHLPLVGDQFKGVADKVNAAREHLRGFADELDAVDGKTVNTEVKVKLPTTELDAFIAKLQSAQTGVGRAVRTDVAPGGGPTFGIDTLKPPKTPKPTKPTGPLTDIPKSIQALEQQKQDAVALAQAQTKSLADDRAALVDLQHFYDEQSNNMKLSAAIRRAFLVKSAQAGAEIRSIDQGIVQTTSDNAEASARAAVEAADATVKNQADDIAARRKLIGVLKDRVKIAQQTGEGVAQAQAAVASAQRDLVAKLNQQRDDRVDLRESKARAALQVAETTEKTLVDDIAAQRRIVGAMKKRVEIAKATKTGVQAALAAQRTEENNLTNLIRDQAQKRADARLDAIQDAEKLASFTDSKADDRAALKREESFWKGRIRALKKGTVERRKAFVELARTRKDIRDLTKDSSGSGTNATTLADLFTKQTSIAAGAGVDVGPQIPGKVTQGIEDQVTAKLAVRDPTVNVRAKVDDTQRAVVDSNEELVRALDRLGLIVSAQGNSAAGTPGLSAQAVNAMGQRGAAMARYYQSRRNANLHEETASA